MNGDVESRDCPWVQKYVYEGLDRSRLVRKPPVWRILMRTLPALGLLISMACSGLGQEDPVENRRIPIRFLTHQPADAFGTGLGLGGDPLAVRQEEQVGLISPEKLVDLLKKDIAPATWEAPGSSLEIIDGALVADARRSVLGEISNWLERARLRHGRRVILDAALVVVPFDRWARAQPRDLLEGATVLKTARLAAVSGQRVVAQDLIQQSYVRDFDVQISAAEAALSPLVDVLNTGVGIHLLPWISPDAEQVILEVQCEAAKLEVLEDKTIKLLRQEAPALPAAGAAPAAVAGTPIQTPWEGHLQLPRTTFDRIRGQVAARMGETVVAAAVSRGDGMLALILTPTLEGEKIPPAGPPTTCLYPVDALAAPIQDWAGPRPELVGPQRGGGGPLTGATFTLDEPRAGYGIEALAEEMRSAVEPDRPKNRESAIQSVGWKTLTVRGTPDVQAAVSRRLREAYQREARILTTEAVVLAFPHGSRALWAKDVPALAPGGSQATDEEMSRLLDAASKGPPVQVSAFLSVSGRTGQRVHILSGRQQNYVQDFEPQVGTASMVYDPIIGMLQTGVGLDARPAPRASDGSVSVELHAWTLSGELEEKRLSTDASPIQCPRVTGFIWEPEIVCFPSKWTLAALESRGTGPAREEFALFVRVR
jgi:hypothetical protein